MIENLTFGDVSSTLAVVVGFIASVAYLHTKLKKWIAHSLDEQLNSITKEIDSLKARIDDVDMESCKNFLVRVLSDIEIDNAVGEIEMERFWEQYGYYKEHGGNTYIQKKVEKLEHEGRL